MPSSSRPSAGCHSGGAGFAGTTGRGVSVTLTEPGGGAPGAHEAAKSPRIAIAARRIPPSIVPAQPGYTPVRMAPASRLRTFLGCSIALLMFGGIPAVAFLLMRHMEGSPTEAANDFLSAMSRGDAMEARMACEPASGIPIESALAAEGAAWGTEWAIQVTSRTDSGSTEAATVEARVKGKDGKSRLVELGLSRFVNWRVSAMKLDGRTSFAPAELPAGMTMPEIRGVVVRKTRSGGGWDVEVSFVVTALKSEPGADGSCASVIHSLVLRGPGGEESYRMETTTEVREGPPGVHAFTDKLRIQPPGDGSKYVLKEVVTDRKTLLLAEAEIEFTLP